MKGKVEKYGRIVLLKRNWDPESRTVSGPVKVFKCPYKPPEAQPSWSGGADSGKISAFERECIKRGGTVRTVTKVRIR
jgi:hypothetical protein